MKIAFSLFKYFPYGGLQQDLIKLVVECLARQHEVRAYIGDLASDFPDLNCELVRVPLGGSTNHGRARQFGAFVQEHLLEHAVDLVVGMNKMPGLDVYYAGDSCYQDKVKTQRSLFYRLLPRYRVFVALERSVFDIESRTKILTIADGEIPKFQKHYLTQEGRFFDLPPGINKKGLSLVDRSKIGDQFRVDAGIDATDRVLVFIGSGFNKKGLDRVIRAFSAIEDRLTERCRLLVIGEDRPQRFIRMAKRLKILEDITFFGGQGDVLKFLCAADGMVLPAYDETAGMVILESITAGLPVLATENCGYAKYIERASCGIISSTPFDQERFNGEVIELLTSPARKQWTLNGLEFSNRPELYRMAIRAVDYFERFSDENKAKN